MSHKFHIVYQTTNLINNKFYIGKHSTNNLEDGYLGSGVILKQVIKKYGSDLFIRDILYFCECPEHAYKIEKEIVTKKFLQENPLCYNLCPGGLGADAGENNFMYGRNHSEESKQKIGEASKNRNLNIDYIINIRLKAIERNKDKKYREKIGNSQRKRLSDLKEREKISISMKEKWKNDSNYKEKMINSFKKRPNKSEKWKKNQSEKMSGQNNSMYGKHHSEESKRKNSESQKGKKFINNGLINTSIKKENLNEYLNNGWFLGKLKKIIDK